MGGAANSRLWTQIKADVTGKYSMFRPRSHYFGSSHSCWDRKEVYRFCEAVARTASITRIHGPDLEVHAKYQKYFEVYLKLYDQLKSVFAESGAIQ